MAYEKNLGRPGLRDGAPASEVAAQRPIGATRTHCVYDESPNDGTHGEENACERFNRELRGGHAGRNDGER